MTRNLKALAIGLVGAVGGLGAVSLAAQSDTERVARDQYSNGSDMILRDGDNGLWHVAEGRIRHCHYSISTFGNDVICTAWR